MGFNKLSGGTANPPRVAIALNAGEYFPLPTGQGGVGQYGAVYPPQLASGNPFSGQYMVNLGLYSVLQVYDQGLNYWWNVCSGGPWAQQLTVSADGYSYRIANT